MLFVLSNALLYCIPLSQMPSYDESNYRMIFYEIDDQLMTNSNIRPFLRRFETYTICYEQLLNDRVFCNDRSFDRFQTLHAHWARAQTIDKPDIVIPGSNDWLMHCTCTEKRLESLFWLESLRFLCFSLADWVRPMQGSPTNKGQRFLRNCTPSCIFSVHRRVVLLLWANIHLTCSNRAKYGVCVWLLCLYSTPSLNKYYFEPVTWG